MKMLFAIVTHGIIVVKKTTGCIVAFNCFSRVLSFVSANGISAILLYRVEFSSLNRFIHHCAKIEQFCTFVAKHFTYPFILELVNARSA